MELILLKLFEYCKRTKMDSENQTHEVLIIGGACAGLSAAIYTARKKLDTLILTKKVGGQALLTDHIVNYPGIKETSGPKLIETMRAQVEDFGVPIEKEKEVVELAEEEGLFFVNCSDNSKYKAKSLIVASGKEPRRLNVPGEEKYRSKGVSYCSTCDGPMFKDKKVAVIGGGNSGLDSAYDLLEYAEKIYLLELSPEIRGDERMQEKLKKSGKVEFITNAKTKKITGDKFMKGLSYENTKTGEEKKLKVSGAFINVGWEASSDFADGFLEKNEYDEIAVNANDLSTSKPGVFAAGDISSTPYEQAVIAAGEGAEAALSCYEYLK